MHQIVKNTLIIPNRRGLHARASAKFARMASEFQADVTVLRIDSNGAMSVPGNSILDLLSLGASQGKEITICCEGPEAYQALEMLSDLVARGFDEDDDDAC